MGWKGNLRSFNAAMKRAEKQRVRVQKAQAAANALSAVEKYERYMSDIVSYHKMISCAHIDWQRLKGAAEPIEPRWSHSREEAASSYLENYQPNFFVRLFRLVNLRLKWLRRRVEKAKQKDEKEYRGKMTEYSACHSKWKSDKELAERMLSGDVDSYVQLIEDRKPFNSIRSFSGDIGISFHDGNVLVNVKLNIEKNVPSETATYLKSGKVSVKDTPKTKYHLLCQDHVCSIALRVARETLALIPVDFIFVTVLMDLLDTSLGELEMKPILSLKVPRNTLDKINFRNVDPSDCMKNFVHNMDFKKSEGFVPVAMVA